MKHNEMLNENLKKCSLIFFINFIIYKVGNFIAWAHSTRQNLWPQIQDELQQNVEI